MSKLNQPTDAGFTSGERGYIRRELDMFFSTYPTVAEGFLLKTCRGGPEGGKPKLSPVAKGLADRGLMRLDAGTTRPSTILHDKQGVLAELRAMMMMDRRFADPKKFRQIRQELGVDPIRRQTFLKNFDQQIVGLEATLAHAQADINQYSNRLAISSNVEHMRDQLQQMQVGSQLDTLAAADNRLSMAGSLADAQSAAKQALGNIASIVAQRGAFIQQWFSTLSQLSVAVRIRA